MSRRPTSEMQFGSDSFLDIVCNVVGILIILIVVAGVRASRAPLALPSASISPPPVPQAAAEPDSLPILVPIADEITAEEPSVPEPLATFPEPPLPVVELPLELVSKSAALKDELQQIDQLAARAEERSSAARKLQAELQRKLAHLEKQQALEQAQLADTKTARAATSAELEQLRQVIAQLSKSLEEQTAKAPPSKTLAHRITPIGQVVTGQELHFQLINNRVSVVPLERLIARLKNQIERHKDWLAKSRQQLGQVGPVEGFTMHYVVERESGSLVDELRMGPGVFRISVSEWRLEVDRSIAAETAQEALRPGSHFYSAVTSAEPGSAMTFWTYPDSFEIYGELKNFCQKQNFLIAGRPLPHGIPIAGSPTGSRSSGQ